MASYTPQQRFRVSGYSLASSLAGDEVVRWNTLTDRMSLILQRLAEQGYIYDRATKTIKDIYGYSAQ